MLAKIKGCQIFVPVIRMNPHRCQEWTWERWRSGMLSLTSRTTKWSSTNWSLLRVCDYTQMSRISREYVEIRYVELCFAHQLIVWKMTTDHTCVAWLKKISRRVTTWHFQTTMKEEMWISNSCDFLLTKEQLPKLVWHCCHPQNGCHLCEIKDSKVSEKCHF